MKIINQERFLNYNIVEFDIVNSTMIIAKDFPENTVIVAKQQEHARGKGDRVWNAENNENLYFSLNIKANKEHLDYSQLSFVASLAMRQSIQEYDKNKNSIVSKWPNDILINSKKCCGILLELDHLTKILDIGIGVNITFYPENTMFKATSLKKEEIITNRYNLLKSFLNNFSFLLKEWESQGFSPIREKWLKNCYRLHQEIEVNNKKGIFDDIDKDGTLIMTLLNGKKYFVKSGDVF